LLMGLRLEEGIDLTGREDAVKADAVERLSALGLIAREGPRLRVTAEGILLLDAILAEIAA